MEIYTNTITASTPVFGMPAFGSAAACAHLVVRPWAQVNEAIAARTGAAVKRGNTGDPAWSVLTS